MHIRIFLALLGVLVISCVQKEETVLYVESNLPSNVQIAFESKLPEYYIKLLNVRYDVVTQYPYIRMIRKDRSKIYRLTRFPGKGWQAFHTTSENIYALLDHVIEGPGHVFHIIEISNNGDIRHVGDIKKNFYFETHIKSYIKGDKLTVITENDTCENIQKTTYEYGLTNNSTRTHNKTRTC